ncbi:MAG: hypothetical protein KDD11_08400, partial [Acidobacteria bacterium]|nr:hypothetical protein [Acidobacteriota bacterium]
MSPRCPSGWRSLLAGALLSLVALPLAAQIHEEDLPPDSFTEIAYERLTTAELQERFQQAVAAVDAAPASDDTLRRLTDLRSILESRLAEQGPEEAAQAAQDRTLLRECLLLLARVHLARGNGEGADVELQ